MVDPKKNTEPTNLQPKRAQALGSPVITAAALSPTSPNMPRIPMVNLSAAVNAGTVNQAASLKIDKQNLISVGLIGALTNNGFSSTAAAIPNLLASAEDSNFNKRLLSRYGCYLIVILIDPSEFGEMVNILKSK